MDVRLNNVASKLSADEGFMTTEEVLEYLQVNLRTAYRLIKNMNIPAIREGRQWRFRRRDIDRRISTRPIIIVTGFSTESSAIEAVNLGVAGRLIKPFKANEVLAVIARALSAPTA
jgi:excisionase family DNA binding protein